MDTRSEPFCDGFTITTPVDDFPGLFSDIQPMMDMLGLSPFSSEGSKNHYYVNQEGAGVLIGKRSGIHWLQAKGRFVDALRRQNMLNEFLALVSTRPHRVSSADLTVDEYVECPADKVAQVYDLARTRSITFSRKTLQVGQIGKVMSPVLYDDSGKDTGTVYLGRRTAEIRGRVYDKTQERAKDGECIGRTVRHEMTITGKMGISLKDIASPGPCFYHFWPSNLLSKADYGEWVGGGLGFEVKRLERLPSQRLKERVERSADLGDMIRLAHEIGPEGMNFLYRLIGEREGLEGRVLGHA